jgi:hypothetical protein
MESVLFRAAVPSHAAEKLVPLAGMALHDKPLQSFAPFSA